MTLFSFSTLSFSTRSGGDHDVDGPRPAPAERHDAARPARDGPTEHRRGLPARARTMAWLLLLTVALSSVVLVTRNLLLADLDSESPESWRRSGCSPTAPPRGRRGSSATGGP